MIGRVRWRVGILVAFAGAAWAHADTLLNKTTFAYTGGTQTYTVPAGANYVVVKAWGAGGSSSSTNPSGGGGFTSATYAATTGQTINVIVGGGAGYPNGGLGVMGGGGGSSRVYLSGGFDLWAGGGGGSGFGGDGGGGGGTTAAHGEAQAGSGSGDGGGGGQSSGGWGGGSDTGNGGVGGSANQGGRSGYDPSGPYYNGGGGGGGYYGGGGGGWSDDGSSGDGAGGDGTSGGGGGGSSYASLPVYTGSASLLGASGKTAAGTSDPDYPGGVANGKGPGYANGQNGYVVIAAYGISGPPVITSATTALADQSFPSSYQITATNIPTAFAATSLPAGLSINTSTGLISGTATTAGTYTSTISATNSLGTGSATLTWTVAYSDFLLSKTTFSFTGGTQTYTVPANTNYISIKAWGAAGGTDAGLGGAGGFTSAQYYVTPGSQIYINVGGGGQYAGGTPASAYGGGWPNGGRAYTVGSGSGGGGGSSEVWGGAVQVWAGGGGGGGWIVGYGGAGGGASGQNGDDYGTGIHGSGGTQTTGGAGGSGGYAAGTSGTAGQGGDGGFTPNGYGGGGGGGGYFGGGGGGSTAIGDPGVGGGGGGGGSGFIATPYRGTGSLLAGSTSNTPNTGDPDYPGGVGNGTTASGQNGYVVIAAYSSNLPTITSLSQPNLVTGQAASFTVAATNSPTSFGAADLPPGLSIDAATGVISGNPTASGFFSPALTATNAYGSSTTTLTWVVSAITANASVTPSSIYLSQAIQFYRDGSGSYGIAFTQSVVWKPDGTADDLGMMGLGGPTTYTPSQIGTYYYQMRIADQYSNFVDELIPFVVAAPGENPPSSVTSTTVGSNFVTISWSGATAQAGIAGYFIYRDGVPIASVPAGSTSYPDSTNSPSTTYTYQVVTVDSQGNHSAASAPLTVTTLAGLELFTPLL